MTWPSSNVNATNVDAGTDSPALARADLLDLLTKFNLLRSHVSTLGQALLSRTTAALMRADLGAAEGNASGQASALNPANSYSVTNLTASNQIAAPYYYSPGVGYFGTATNNSINFVTNNLVHATLDSGGNFSASSFNGSGAGLTGTAASLTAGAANNAIGHGQTWVNAGIVAGTGYTNTYGRPIAIMIATQGTQSITMTIGGYTFPATGTFSNDVNVFTFIIPTGAAYSFTGTAVAWSARLS